MATPDVTIACTNYLEQHAVHLRYGKSFRFGVPWMPRHEPLLQDDLLKVAGVIFLADRAFRRHARLGDWTRSFACRLKVAEPKRWSRAATALTQAASFLTDDNWSFEFIPTDRKTHVASWAAQDARNVASDKRYGPVALFSGGLDSFCGACQLFAGQAASQRVPVFVTSFVTELTRLTDLVTAISRSARDGPFLHLPVYGVSNAAQIKGLATAMLPERSRRSRSLYFLFQAIAAAIEFGVDDIHLYENGVLAFNLPLRPDESGSRSTRHAHPYFIELVNGLIGRLGGDRKIVLSNPYALQTKAEILRHVDTSSQALIGKTVSCWGYPNEIAGARTRRRQITHCGRCLPCLIRRLALHSAVVFDDPKIYRQPNLFEAARKGFPIRKTDFWLQARKLLGFASRIGSSKAEDLIWRFGGYFLHLAPDVNKKDVQAAHDLYVRFSAEVERAFAP